MGELKIRRATIEDARDIATVRVRTWQAAYRGMLPDSHLNAMDIEANASRGRTIWFAEEAKGVHWVCTEDNEVIGWTCTFLRARDEDLDGAVAELVACYALKRAWGRGVGFKMWEIALAGLMDNGARHVILWVLTENLRAIDFYERQGFVRDGKTKVVTVEPGVELDEVRLRLDL